MAKQENYNHFRILFTSLRTLRGFANVVSNALCRASTGILPPGIFFRTWNMQTG